MLLIGPPGSGKTERILSEVERAVRAGRADEVLLLVPTASMRAHLISTLARRGLMVPVAAVTTLPEFVREQSPGLKQSAPAWEGRLLGQVLAGSGSRWLRSLAGSSRLRARMAALMREFWAVGADSFQLEPGVRGPQQRAFMEAFREFEIALADEGRVHPNQRIAAVASSIRENGLEAVRSVFVDGFDQFTRQQEELLAAIEEQSEEFVVAMPEGLPSYPSISPQEMLPPSPGRSSVRTTVLEAPSPRAEVLEIARRILASGRAIREHAVIVRSPELYNALIREVFESLEIPHRFWHREPAFDHAVCRHFLRWLRVIHRKFPAEESLEAISSPLSPVAGPDQVDAFDFAVREILPGSGFAFLEGAAGPFPEIQRFLGRIRHCRQWHRRRVGAKRWAIDCLDMQERLQLLKPPLEPGSFQDAQQWRDARAASLSVRTAIEEAVSMPDFKGRKRPSLLAFADAVEDVLRSAGKRLLDQRSDVVNILPVGEARQWSVPVAFACGLAEGWFPRAQPQDPFFGDDGRQRLRAHGIALRTTAQLAEQELLRFKVASTRGTQEQVLTYPRSDGTGTELSRSAFLEGLSDGVEAPPPARLGSSGQAALPEGSSQLHANLLDDVAARNQSFNVSGIRDYRQCPYLYFSGQTLDLSGRPLEPADRLNAQAVGRLVHSAIDRWNRDQGSIGDLLDQAFRSALRELHLAPDFRSERLRLALRADLERFAGAQVASMAVPPSSLARFEETVELRVARPGSGQLVRCRIDRYDFDAERRCLVTDYKYSRSAAIRRLLKRHLAGEELQLVLYLAALEQNRGLEPAGMLLIGLRGETSVAGASVGGARGLKSLSEERMHELLAIATQEAGETVGEVLGGTIAVQPRDTGYCERLCRFKSVCRVAWPSRSLPASEGRGSR